MLVSLVGDTVSFQGCSQYKHPWKNSEQRWWCLCCTRASWRIVVQQLMGALKVPETLYGGVKEAKHLKLYQDIICLLHSWRFSILSIRERSFEMKKSEICCSKKIIRKTRLWDYGALPFEWEGDSRKIALRHWGCLRKGRSVFLSWAICQFRQLIVELLLS